MTGSTEFGLFASRKVATAAICAAAALALAGCGGKKDKNVESIPLAPSQTTSIGVNSYLWRASLDTLSFMPLLESDSKGGVIITDWYVNPDKTSERMKVSVMILDQDLRADALRVSAARQVLQDGQWQPAPVEAATVQKLENVILTRARDLRRESTPIIGG
ncbi:DUF3576 domain-containing protein [Novosphingobium sp. 1949]|uniref:DUF3576 domain-containing protein n=1 Tax=Novosphingobium organovorum TaxID=2930092 RepID=A0ABT0BGV5_9SPHN|nr:DUF3576 domain-containing protein [Novosphingobium organovorum]MCJ2184300.1 DUF3576 domain-containing protein [Novosphingobium organovorum]